MQSSSPSSQRGSTETLWTLGRNIHRHRVQLGMTQLELAEHPRLAVTRQTVSRWETGRCMPEREHLFVLAEIFKTTPDQLWKRQR